MNKKKKKKLQEGEQRVRPGLFPNQKKDGNDNVESLGSDIYISDGAVVVFSVDIENTNVIQLYQLFLLKDGFWEEETVSEMSCLLTEVGLLAEIPFREWIKEDLYEKTSVALKKLIDFGEESETECRGRIAHYVSTLMGLMQFVLLRRILKFEARHKDGKREMIDLLK